MTGSGQSHRFNEFVESPLRLGSGEREATSRLTKIVVLGGRHILVRILIPRGIPSQCDVRQVASLCGMAIHKNRTITPVFEIPQQCSFGWFPKVNDSFSPLTAYADFAAPKINICNAHSRNFHGSAAGCVDNFQYRPVPWFGRSGQDAADL